MALLYGIGTVVAVVGASIIAAKARYRYSERNQHYLHERWNRMARANDFATWLNARTATDRVVENGYGMVALHRARGDFSNDHGVICAVPQELWRKYP